MKIMAIDYGDARTGIAISDSMGFMTGHTLVIQTRKTDLISEITALCKEHQISEVVLGYPKNMNGSIGPRAEKSSELAEELRLTTELPVILWDERRTTVDAHRILSETGNHGKKRKDKIDAVAASLILEGYLTLKKMQA
ncbi:MAG: Holliday junction resolvase RuvX [Evtepia sp.]